MIHKISTRDFNSLDIRFLHLFFRNSDSENTVLHRCLNLIHLRILWQPETPQELATAALDTVPRVILVFLLYLPLSANPNHSVIINLDFHLLFFEPRKISLKHMGFWGFLPINSGIDESRGLCRKLRHIQR
ncbi:hypothetical protein ACB092_08G072300 [Castanea dentata]